MEQAYDHNQLWYSHQGPPIEKGTEEIWFYDEDLPFRKYVESHYETIRQELLGALNSGQVEINNSLNNRMSSGVDKWQSFTFRFWGMTVSKHNCTLCPKTLEILDSIPGCLSSSVSVLEPQSSIHPHRGDTNAVYRCHLPLLVPAGLPDTGFYVGYEERPWREGELLVFNDAAYHKAWNQSDSHRVLLIFDVLRPGFMHREKEICTEILGNLSKLIDP